MMTMITLIKFFIDDDDLQKWSDLKGSKSIEKTTKDGYSYTFRRAIWFG